MRHEKSSRAVEYDDCNHIPPFLVGNDRFVALRPSKPIYTDYQGPPFYATVIAVDHHGQVTESWLRQTLETYRSTDDVFRDDFLSSVIFTREASEAGLKVTAGATKLLKSLGNNWVFPIDIYNPDDAPSPGPYVIAKQHLLEIFRLYDDIQGAFTSSFTMPQSAAEELHIGGKYMQVQSIAVPSRLRDSMTSGRPLAGLRVAVKDIFQIEGIRTSLCNRAYYDLYLPATKTAGCITILRQLGATVVGTTKLASFAATEEPIECVDFQAPWNPRADGYQSPAGSSSGSGVAVASYSWLDIAIGSDTSGSGRRPAHWNGCFSMRPSHGLLPVDGYVPSFKQFDVPCFYGREIEKCRSFADHWYGNLLPDLASLPPCIIYPSDCMALITNRDQMNIIDKFVVDLEFSLGIQHTKVSFDSLWKSSPPTEAGGQDLREYMQSACKDSFFYDDYHNFDQFRKDYQEKFSKNPYVSPPVRWQWDLSSKITEAERDTAIKRLEVYRKWFFREVMQVEKYNSIVIIPIENISPRYRDDATSRFSPVGVPMLFLSPITEGPELTIPVGETPFQSRVSGNLEHLPVAVSLLASPGRDIELFDIAQECLDKSGRATSVCAGNKLFSD